MNSVIVFSHGFGVKKDARGLFPAISDALGRGYSSIMFDYNDVDENSLTIYPFSEQLSRLQAAISDVPGDTEMTLICHSQGCIVGSMLEDERVTRVIMLAPPDSGGAKRVRDRMFATRGARILDNGLTSASSRDGTTRLITPEYWNELDSTKPIELYQAAAKRSAVTIITASNDDVLGETNFDSIDDAQISEIIADHDFTGESRQRVVDVVVAKLKEN